jgi:hypothetical protein
MLPACNAPCSWGRRITNSRWGLVGGGPQIGVISKVSWSAYNLLLAPGYGKVGEQSSAPLVSTHFAVTRKFAFSLSRSHRCPRRATDFRGRAKYRGFADLASWTALHHRVESAVFDGEIACVDDAGRPVFRDLLFRRRQCVFIVFDLLYLNGKDLRALSLSTQREKGDAEETAEAEALTNPLPRSRRW